MGKLLKILLSLIASVILLVIVLAVALPFFIDPNDYKPEIQAAVAENLGRELQIEGNLELSVFPWIGVSTGKLILSNSEVFSGKPFAEINESNVKVKLLPLFSQQLEVSRIVLKGLVLNLVKNKQGVANWDDLASSDSENTQTKEDHSVKGEQNNVSPLAALAVGGISLEQAQIIWDDQQQGVYTEIKNLNFNTEKLQFDKPIGIDLSLLVINKEPELTEAIKISTDLTINQQLDVIKLSRFTIDSTTTGKDIPGGKLTANLVAEIALDLAQQTLNIPELKLNSGNLTLSANITGTQIIDSPLFKGPINIAEFNLAQFLQHMAVPLPEMQGPQALHRVSLGFDLQATADSADLKNILIKLDDTNIKGSTQIKNFAKAEINFDINVDTIDVDRYLAPVKQGDSSKPIATPATVAAAGATLLPVETLRGLHANGQLNIANLTVNQLKMQGVSLKLQAKNGLIKTRQAVKHLYQGSYSGVTTINAKNKSPVLALNEKMTQVQVEPLLKDMLGEARMTGVVNVSAKIKSRGNTVDAMKSSLNGSANFSFKNGVIKGFNLQKIIDNGKAYIAGTKLPTDNKNDQTVFSVISASTRINNGVVSNDNLYAESSKLRVNGQGKASLVSEKLDYEVTAKLLKAVPTATQPEKIKGLPIIIDIGGTFSEPSYQLDVAAMLMAKNKDKINKKKDELLKKLDEKIAPGVSDLLKGFF